MNSVNLTIEQIKERRLGHADIWECTSKEFKEKVLPEIKKQQNNSNIRYHVVILASSFLRTKFEAKELKGTIEYEVAKSIEEAMIYYVNILNEDK